MTGPNLQGWWCEKAQNTKPPGAFLSSDVRLGNSRPLPERPRSLRLGTLTVWAWLDQFGSLIRSLELEDLL